MDLRTHGWMDGRMPGSWRHGLMTHEWMMYGWMDAWIPELTDQQKHKWMHGCVDRWMHRLMDDTWAVGRMVGWTHGSVTHGSTDTRLDGHTDGRTHEWTEAWARESTEGRTGGRTHERADGRDGAGRG